MPTSTNWSSASAICQLEWRPSSAVAWALRLLGLLAALSLLSCEMPAGIALPSGLGVLAYGAWLARGYRRQAACHLRWIAGRPPEIDGVALRDAQMHWRGPLAFLRGRNHEGRVLRLAWWPDTLPRDLRRELRLVSQVAPVTPSMPAMAP